ncbi:MAG: MerR family transcriptional regulator [Halieaceae bacterium]
MQQANLEPRPLHGIGTVARLTGLKPDTLRVWERRYGLGASHKSATGRRQYTQADLEHLQMVAALVNNGSRIGEIASSERKTLEMLLRGQASGAKLNLPESKPRVVFMGEQLCSWLEEHQGCIANVDALLARFAPAAAEPTLFEDMGKVDSLIVECATLSSTSVRQLTEVIDQLQPGRVLVTYQFGNERWLSEFEKQGITTTTFPPDPAYIAFEIGRSVAEKATGLGETNLGELIASKPRRFDETQLSAARSLKSTLDCECPRHIADLIRALAHFEEYSSSCSVENWHDAAVHSSIYAYTGQARWLMERALEAVLEERGEEFQQLMQAQGKSEKISDAA